MSFNIKQIKNIKFLLIIFVILLLFFIAYLFLGKKMREGLDNDPYSVANRCYNGPPWRWNMTNSQALSRYPNLFDSGGDVYDQPNRDPTCPPITGGNNDGNQTTTTTTTTTNNGLTGYTGGLGPERCTTTAPPYGWAMTSAAAAIDYPLEFNSTKNMRNQTSRDPTCPTTGNTGNTGNTTDNTGNTGSAAQLATLQTALDLANSQAAAARTQLTTLQASNTTNAATLSAAQAALATALQNVRDAEAAAASRAQGVPGASIYLYPGSSQSNYPNYSLYNNNNLLQQQQLAQLQQSQYQEQQPQIINNIRGSSSEKKKKICYAPYKNEKDCENAGYIWDNNKKKCRKPNMDKGLLKEFKELRTKVNSLLNSKNKNTSNTSNASNDDKYILKTQIVPPVCPACPSYKCGVSEPQKLNNSILDDATNNDLLNSNNMILNERNFARNMKPPNEFGRMPLPLLADFSQFM
jgi:hypothetical protein